MKELLYNTLANKKILILGFGREGKSTLNTISNVVPEENITIADSKIQSIPNDILSKFKCISGPDYANNINDFDVIIKSPGIPESIIKNISEDKITSQTDLFLQQYHNQIIGITGTKGKSTTSSLIAHLLSIANIKNILVGNIGIPAFSSLDIIDNDTVIVMELSAHQLNHINIAPHISIFLNIFEEHLDHFGTFEKYFDAKCNIFRKQTDGDILIIDSDNQMITNKLKDYHNKIVNIDINNISGIVSNLKGIHNQKNIAFAYSTAKLLNISEDKIREGIITFQPLPHRLEYVGKYCGIEFYNDSISTIPEASIAAIEALRNVGTIIIGGFDRGIIYNKLVRYLIKSEVDNIILTGQAGKRIGRLLSQKENNKRIFTAANMEEIIKIAYENTLEGKKCLLSPAASSYDQYTNFEERGKCFIDTVRKYKDRKK